VTGKTSFGVIMRKATRGMVTPMTAAMITSLGEFTARYTSENDRAATRAAMTGLPTRRSRPAGASEYSMPIRVAVRAATGREGLA
jgi:hypothetical protein